MIDDYIFIYYYLIIEKRKIYRKLFYKQTKKKPFKIFSFFINLNAGINISIIFYIKFTIKLKSLAKYYYIFNKLVLLYNNLNNNKCFASFFIENIL